VADKKLPISVVISAVDNVTYKVMAINEKIKRITAPVGKVKEALSNLGDESGIGKLGKHLGEVGKTGKEFFSSLGDAMLKIGAVGVGAATAIYAVTHSFSEAGDEVATLSKRLGLSTDAYQELAYAANKAQVPQEEFNGAMTKFSKGIGEAAAGTGEAFIGFNALGISVRDSSGHIKKLDDLLPVVADKLGAIQNQNLRNAVAAKIFGREGAKLNEIFNEGSAGLAKLRQEAHKVGAVMTPEQIKTAQEFDDGMKSVQATLLSVRNTIGAALAPVVLQFGENIQKYILSHQEEIKNFAAAFADKLPGVLDQIGHLLQNIASAMGPVISLFKFLSSIFGEVNVTAAALFTWFGGPAIINLFKFANALSGALVPALKFAYTAFSLLSGLVIDLLAGFVALVGWPVILGAALIGAAVAIWKWWEPIKEGILSIWDKVSGFFGTTTTLDQNINTSSTMGPQLGPALGFSKTVDAADRSTETKNENHVVVDFKNMPQGTRVEKQKDEGNIDLFMGYAGLAHE
jgi:hypothetical protein